jgi:ribosomal protein S18 acetylase RimI-like enzyme
VARVRAMSPADWAAAARLTQVAGARELIALPWESEADLARLAGVPGVTLLVAEDEAGQLAGVGGFRLGRRGEAHLWGPVVATEGHGIGAWLMHRMEALAEAEGATAFVLTLALANRSGAAWAAWRGYLRDDESWTYQLCTRDLRAPLPAPQTTVHYRPATPADVPRLITLAGTAFPAGYLSQDEWASVLDEVTMAERGGTVVGFLWLRRQTGRIKLLVVDAAFRRQGIGRGLLLQALQTAQERGHQHLEAKVRQENEAMLALLRQLGFNRFVAVSSWIKRPG